MCYKCKCSEMSFHFIMRSLSTLFVLLLCVALHDAGRFYRCDYTFFPEADGWLKFHEIPVLWSDARLTCKLEGATLASPIFPGVLNATLELMRKSFENASPNTSRDPASFGAVYTGFHSTYVMKNFASLEGIPLSEVPHKWRDGVAYKQIERSSDTLVMNMDGELFGVDGEEAEYPFVCYKEYQKMQSTECGTYDPDYIPELRLGSCYKYHGLASARPWREAYRTCAAEGGHLVVANSDHEAEYLQSIVRKNRVDTPKGKSRHCGEDCDDLDGSSENVLLVGVTRLHYSWMPLTIQDETPTEAGYSRLGQKHLNKDGQCVAIDERGFLIYVDCNVWYRFACEKKPGKSICD